MISWHASALHAALSTIRELVVDRVEAASDLLAHVRESIDASARVDLVSLTVARLVRRMEETERIARSHARRLVIVESRYPASDHPARAAIDDLDRRVKALEASVDKDAK